MNQRRSSEYEDSTQLLNQGQFSDALPPHYQPAAKRATMSKSKRSPKQILIAPDGTFDASIVIWT